VIVARVLVGLAGLAVMLTTTLSAARTTVLPRGVASRLARAVFLGLRALFRLRLGRSPTYERRDEVFASYGPLSLLALLQVWLLLIWLGGAAAMWAVTGEGRSVHRALGESGSSLLTLGFIAPHGARQTALTFVEASLGLLLVALLISFLPAIYSAFSRREATVSKLQVRAGSPPCGWELLIRFFRIQGLDQLDGLWRGMEDWFVDIEESHTSFAALVFFRSPQPDHSWVTASGATLDAAALRVSALDLPNDPDAQLCLRAGYLALRSIADYFDVPYDPDPAPDDPISVTRVEVETVLDELAAAGLALRADRDQVWADFAGWRVNYDTPLLALAALALAPYAPWSSDRSLAGLPRPGLLRRPRLGPVR